MRRAGVQASDQPVVVLAAGGTGGHVMPARALAEDLRARGLVVGFVTDRRGLPYLGRDGEEAATLVLEAGRLSAGLGQRLQAVGRMGPNLLRAQRFLRRMGACTLVSFGGYPTLPAGAAAQVSGLVSVVHEQNAVMGRANRLLARRARLVALSFPQTQRIPRTVREARVVGLPLRRQVREATPRAVAADSNRRLLVLGGSQGARIMADLVPAAVAAIAPAWRGRLEVTQQARPEDLARTRAAYAAAGISAEVAAFFPDLPQRMAEADLVIARAGAATLFELAALARPAIVVPLLTATDDHQSRNARHFALKGGVRVLPEADAEPRRLAEALSTLLGDGDELRRMAAAMAGLARKDAAHDLGELITALLRRPADHGAAVAHPAVGGGRA